VLADATGKWTGTFDATGRDGKTKAPTAFMALKQSGDGITGTVGHAEDHQMSIKAGKIDGNKIALEVEGDEGGVITFDLTLTDGHIKGDAKGEHGGEKLTAKGDVTPAKRRPAVEPGKQKRDPPSPDCGCEHALVILGTS